MKKICMILIVIAALYYMKVPVVVAFVDQLLATSIPVWDTMIDSWLHFMERHPYIYMCLPACLVYLMVKEHI